MKESDRTLDKGSLEHLASLPNLMCSVIADPNGTLADKVGKAASSDDEKANKRVVSDASCISRSDLQGHIGTFLDGLGGPDAYDDVLIVPPDFTRFHSHAGIITEMVADYYQQLSDNDANDGQGPSKFQILPALGTHAPMTQSEIAKMFGTRLDAKNEESSDDEPLFVVHDWRRDVETIGHVDDKLVEAATHGMVKDQPWPAQLNSLVWSKRRKDQPANKNLILSIGQVVPHEVLGMANFNKNLFVGVGGTEAINLSHFIGAVHGMEKLMGRGQNPLRHILNVASEQFLKSPQEIHLWYILTVIGSSSSSSGQISTNSIQGAAQQPPGVELKGLFIGNDITCYNHACDLSLQLNFILLPKEPKCMVVYLDPEEFHSTWLGNKAIYRTRMAIADNGHLIILAPGVCKFGEDDQIDKLIRKYGYIGTKEILNCMEEEDKATAASGGDGDHQSSLRNNLSAVAHLIHGSTEGRFNVTYCPGHLTQQEVEGVGFQYGDVQDLMKTQYDVSKLRAGWNVHPTTGEEYYFINNPALGLWAVPSRFE